MLQMQLGLITNKTFNMCLFSNHLEEQQYYVILSDSVMLQFNKKTILTPRSGQVLQQKQENT